VSHDHVTAAPSLCERRFPIVGEDKAKCQEGVSQPFVSPFPGDVSSPPTLLVHNGGRQTGACQDAELARLSDAT
jgi:hypothetical protein